MDLPLLTFSLLIICPSSQIQQVLLPNLWITTAKTTNKLSVDFFVSFYSCRSKSLSHPCCYSKPSGVTSVHCLSPLHGDKIRISLLNTPFSPPSCGSLQNLAYFHFLESAPSTQKNIYLEPWSSQNQQNKRKCPTRQYTGIRLTNNQETKQPSIEDESRSWHLVLLSTQSQIPRNQHKT